MGISSDTLPFVFFHAAQSVIYAILLFIALRRQRIAAPPVIGWLACYVLLSLLNQAVQFAGEAGWFAAQLDEVSRLSLNQYAAFLLSFILYQGLRAFLNQGEAFWLLGGQLVLAAVLVIFQQFSLVFIGWGIYTLLAMGLLFFTLAKTSQPLHRARLYLWIPAFALTIANEILLFYQQDSQFDVYRLGATLFLTLAALSHRLPDLREIARQTLVYGASALFSMAVYILGFLAADYFFRDMSGYQPIFAGAGVAVLISLMFTPIFSLTRRAVDSLMRLENADPAQILREYSVSINNILELEKLTDVALEAVTDAYDINRALLFLVDAEMGNKGDVYRLTAALNRQTGIVKVSGVLSKESPIARAFREQSQPLLQYDIDFAPEYINSPVSERRWLSELNLDVYAPILSKGEWIGLLGLGSKRGQRYTPQDLTLLATIANQTGVALENARLVENLKKLNAQVREAYIFLDKANHDLAKLEMTKSNFISIASHELRTPLTVIKGYTEMLMESDSLDAGVREFMKGIHKNTLRLHEIMDSMFDVAQIDARAIELQRQDVLVNELIRSVVNELGKVASEREQEITLDLPQLPYIKADPNTLRKLFHHTIINAIKFTPNGGKVTITGRQLPSNNRDLPEGGVEIIVSDTGVGIDKGYQEVIFTKFYQPGELLNRHSTGKTKFKGSGVGLGLALSRGIVEAHGGKIWVESPGYNEETCPGSEFHIILPLRSQGESKTVRMGSAVKLKLN